jgi:hypothetical protein
MGSHKKYFAIPLYFQYRNADLSFMTEIIAVTFGVETVHFVVLMLPMARKLPSYFLAIIVLYAFDAFLVSSLESMLGMPDRRKLRKQEADERR